MTNPPKKNPATQTPETPVLVFATIFAYVIPPENKEQQKNAKGTARWKRARCVVSWPWTCTTSPGLKETAKLLCAAPPSDGLEDGDGGGCIVSFLVTFFF